MDNVAWGALAVSLTVVGALCTWLAFRRRGVTSGLRVLAFTLLPLAAYLTRTLKMFGRIFDAVASWATSLVFYPSVWLGLVLAGVSALLFVVSGSLRSRELGTTRPPRADRRSRRGETPEPALAAGPEPEPAGRGTAVVSDDMDDIEAILRKRGIS